VVAAGFDYSLHLNPREGTTRTAVREGILRHRKGEETHEPEGGDIIILGRNTFKEAIRGINEGYLGPLENTPPPAQPDSDNPETKPLPLPLPPIPPTEYSGSPDPPESPDYIFTYIPSLHILGFRHTPLRIYRLLTRRYIADEIGSQVAAAILSHPEREWNEGDLHAGKTEEKYWPKTVRKESEWREPLVVDPRVQGKLRWRVPGESQEVVDYREASAPEGEGTKVEELVPTEEELSRPPPQTQRPFASPGGMLPGWGNRR
jgi:Inner membrane protein import complex subunit Tim54